jgi:hypothetical protein
MVQRRAAAGKQFRRYRAEILCRTFRLAIEQTSL